MWQGMTHEENMEFLAKYSREGEISVKEVVHRLIRIEPQEDILLAQSLIHWYMELMMYNYDVVLYVETKLWIIAVLLQLNPSSYLSTEDALRNIEAVYTWWIHNVERCEIEIKDLTDEELQEIYYDNSIQKYCAERHMDIDEMISALIEQAIIDDPTELIQAVMYCIIEITRPLVNEYTDITVSSMAVVCIADIVLADSMTLEKTLNRVADLYEEITMSAEKSKQIKQLKMMIYNLEE